ncbi:hypothetical protein DPMN_175179 [Dreissena polymorpha]|uniref:Uncharacterized protein n=1 Tax=Dreissena polymorpha TaxID=45954 RepID=A0A9D4IHV2_DREPO|nr:hypothetical protein DPMN_175179 [Dreissena polymorpha]
MPTVPILPIMGVVVLVMMIVGFIVCKLLGWCSSRAEIPSQANGYHASIDVHIVVVNNRHIYENATALPEGHQNSNVSPSQNCTDRRCQVCTIGEEGTRLTKQIVEMNRFRISSTVELIEDNQEF